MPPLNEARSERRKVEENLVITLMVPAPSQRQGAGDDVAYGPWEECPAGVLSRWAGPEEGGLSERCCSAAENTGSASRAACPPTGPGVQNSHTRHRPHTLTRRHTHSHTHLHTTHIHSIPHTYTHTRMCTHTYTLTCVNLPHIYTSHTHILPHMYTHSTHTHSYIHTHMHLFCSTGKRKITFWGE